MSKSRSPRVLLFGDLHLRKGHLVQGQECCRALVETSKKVKPDLIVLLGDVLHTHEMVYVKALKLFEGLLEQLRNIAPVRVLVGNHDFTSASENQSTEHPLGSFKKWAKVKIIDHAMLDDFFIKHGYRLLLTPYIPYGGHFIAEMDRLLESASGGYATTGDVETLILAHQPFSPLDPKAEHWPLDYPMVFSGHIHDRRSLQENVYYVGSSSQVAMDELPDKYACVVTLGPEGITFETPRLDVRSIAVMRLKYDEFSVEKVMKVARYHDVRLIISSSREEKEAFMASNDRHELLAAGVKTTWDLPMDKGIGNSKVKTKSRRGNFSEILKILVDKSGDEKIQSAYERVYRGDEGEE